ncbi:MAG: TonB-dependent receptor [Opitutus sp.]|nr:TonB-dependent receptor [Opitutus sp.]
MKAVAVLLFTVVPVAGFAQGAVSLPLLTVYSPQVANQSPASSFAMPVSALRFEPHLDIQMRNLAEGQADVTIRGGIFENTAFQVGAVTLIDPQTGHYVAELPIAPALLTAPSVRTGVEVNMGATNATVGAVEYGWRPIRTAGAAGVGYGEHGLRRAELYQGFATKPAGGAARIGMDVAVAHSESDGSIPFGEHEFDRLNLRLQRVDATAQTDVFGGYQGKRFGWTNLYTPFNSPETENLQTTLFALNHRVTFGAGEFLELGGYHRRNKDDYAFNRFAPLGPVHPFQHTTWVNGAAAGGRRDFGEVAINFRAEILADELKSTSLTFGRYRTRTLTKIAVAPERTWTASDGARTTLKAGAAFEDSSRDRGAVSPVFEVAREFPSAALRRVSFSYAGTSQVPTYTALNSNAAAGLFRGNPNLGREKSHALDLGAAGSVVGWTTRGAIFWRRDDALVDWTFRRGVTARTANAVDVDVAGLELVARRSWSACDVVVGYTALTKNSDYRGAVVDASFYALNYARHRLTAALTARLGDGFELRVDNVARLQAGNLLRVIGGDDALTTAVGLSYRPPAWRGVEFSVSADNLWNNKFQEVPAVPAARRQLSVGASYAW